MTVHHQSQTSEDQPAPNAVVSQRLWKIVATDHEIDEFRERERKSAAGQS